MRSRYSAFVVGDAGYLLATWHGSTRPSSLTLDPNLQWTGLDIAEVRDGGDRAVVEFRARFRESGHPGEQHERSRFLRRAGRWFYVDGKG